MHAGRLRKWHWGAAVSAQSACLSIGHSLSKHCTANPKPLWDGSGRVDECAGAWCWLHRLSIGIVICSWLLFARHRCAAIVMNDGPPCARAHDNHPKSNDRLQWINCLRNVQMRDYIFPHWWHEWVLVLRHTYQAKKSWINIILTVIMNCEMCPKNGCYK